MTEELGKPEVLPSITMQKILNDPNYGMISSLRALLATPTPSDTFPQTENRCDGVEYLFGCRFLYL